MKRRREGECNIVLQIVLVIQRQFCSLAAKVRQVSRDIAVGGLVDTEVLLGVVWVTEIVHARLQRTGGLHRAIVGPNIKGAREIVDIVQ